MPKKPTKKTQDNDDDYMPSDSIDEQEYDDDDWDEQDMQGEEDEILDDELHELEDEKKDESDESENEHDADKEKTKPKKRVVKTDEEEEEEEVSEIIFYEDEDMDDETILNESTLIKHCIVVAPNERKTSERCSIFETGRIIGDRARHIDNKAPVYIDATNCASSLEIAYLEFVAKKIPVAVIRKIGRRKVEVWKLSEMIIPKLPPLDRFIS